jgi:hypothetical protein
MNNPKQFAIKMIEHYVNRGETISQMKSGQLGVSCDEYRGAIGGYSNGKKFTSDWLVISRIGKEECEFAFKLTDLFDEILNEQPQLVLL